MKIHFLAPLSNTNTSILKLELENGYSINAFDQDLIVSMVSILEGKAPLDTLFALNSTYLALNYDEKQTYAVCKSIEADFKDKSDHATAMKLLGESQEYLKDKLRLMRLYKSGNVSTPVLFVYLGNDDRMPKNSLMSLRSNKNLIPESFTLEDNEVLELNEFLRNTKIPFDKDFLQLGFDNFENSYEAMPQSTAFLSLMLGVEALLSPSDRDELRYRISRRAAILLGNNFEERETIFKRMKSLYDKRSELVHSGRSDISSDELSEFRSYVRELIKGIYKLGFNKQDLGDSLDRLGFRDLDQVMWKV